MRSPEFVADAEIAAADGILTFDPETEEGHTIWGSDTIARGRAVGAPAYQLKMLNLTLAQDDLDGLRRLLDRVLRVRGRLPQPMQRLREQLAA